MPGKGGCPHAEEDVGVVDAAKPVSLVMVEDRLGPLVHLVQVEHLEAAVHQRGVDVRPVYRRLQVRAVMPSPVLLLQLQKVSNRWLVIRVQGHRQELRHRHVLSLRRLGNGGVGKSSVNLCGDDVLVEDLAHLQANVAQTVPCLPGLPALWHDQLGNPNLVSTSLLHRVHELLPVLQLLHSGVEYGHVDRVGQVPCHRNCNLQAGAGAGLI